MSASTIYLQDIADAVLEARTAANMSQISGCEAKGCSQTIGTWSACTNVARPYVTAA